MRAKAVFSLLTIFCISIIWTACSSGPNGPQPGTPAFYWAAAKETFSGGDYMKTNENLDRAMKGSEFESKALVWALVLNAGLVNGYQDLADDFDKGAKANHTNPGAFRKRSSNYRRVARPLTLELAEKYQTFQKTNKDAEITLAFPFPSGTAVEAPVMSKVTGGMILPEAELENAQKRTLARAMILAATGAAGAAEDSSKAQQLFKAGEVKVPRATFLVAMAQALYGAGDLYSPKRLFETDKVKLFSEMALEALKGAPASTEVKALTEKIQKTLKPLKKTT
jgi:hypothetical protein